MHTRWELLHILTGILIFGLLGTHLVVLHLDSVMGLFGNTGLDPASWNSMIERSRQIVWVGIYISLLAVVLFHALYGLRGIIFELNPSPTAERWISRSFIVIGTLIFIWAAYVPLYLIGR
jgi:succinate dehydrogenase/fumarate reductase cytochrome b subunit